MKKVRRNIIKLFWLVFSISMFLILGVTITRPLNNLIPQRMVLYTFVWVCFYGGLWFLFCFLERKYSGLERVMKCCLPIYLIGFGTALFVVSCSLRCEVFTDYGNVYNAAMNFALGEEVTNWDYFSQWTNNVGCMLGLALFFFPGRYLPEQVDVYYFALLCNVLLVVAFVYCLYYLAGKIFKEHSLAASLMTLAVCTGWIPLWANTSIFYSDQMSLVWGVIGLTLLRKGSERHRGQVYFLAAGVTFAIGMIFKVIAGTIVIALAVTCFLFPELWKEKRRLLVSLGGFLAVFLLFSGYSSTLPYQEDLEALKAPVEYWFAMGLVDRGTYADNLEFADACLNQSTMEERTGVAREQIANEIHNLWDTDHIVAKARQNFGSGDFGSALYLTKPMKENILWHWFSQEGMYYWKYACMNTSLFFAVLFYLGIGGFLQFCKKQERQDGKDIYFFVAALAFWGLCLFMMLWEAQNKFLYGHSGWMIIGLVCSLYVIGERINSVKRHR